MSTHSVNNIQLFRISHTTVKVKKCFISISCHLHLFFLQRRASIQANNISGGERCADVVTLFSKIVNKDIYYSHIQRILAKWYLFLCFKDVLHLNKTSVSLHKPCLHAKYVQMRIRCLKGQDCLIFYICNHNVYIEFSSLDMVSRDSILDVLLSVSYSFEILSISIIGMHL